MMMMMCVCDVRACVQVRVRACVQVHVRACVQVHVRGFFLLSFVKQYCKVHISNQNDRGGADIRTNHRIPIVREQKHSLRKTTIRVILLDCYVGSNKTIQYKHA